jgi:hypothetical protein
MWGIEGIEKNVEKRTRNRREKRIKENQKKRKELD